MVHEIKTLDEFNQLMKVKTNQKHVLVDFYADWCGPCKRISPQLDTLSKSHPNIIFVKVNVDEVNDVSDFYKVKSLPTFILLKQGSNKVVDSTVGADINKIKALVESVNRNQVVQPNVVQQVKATTSITHVKSVDEFNEILTNTTTSQKYMLVDFYATWCGPCKKIAPELETLSKKYPNVTFLKVDVDELSELSERYKINAMPTFMMFKKGSKSSINSMEGADIEGVEKMITALNPVKINTDF